MKINIAMWTTPLEKIKLEKMAVRSLNINEQVLNIHEAEELTRVSKDEIVIGKMANGEIVKLSKRGSDVGLPTISNSMGYYNLYDYLLLEKKDAFIHTWITEETWDNFRNSILKCIHKTFSKEERMAELDYAWSRIKRQDEKNYYVNSVVEEAEKKVSLAKRKQTKKKELMWEMIKENPRATVSQFAKAQKDI